MRSGRIKRRAGPLEKAVARVCREAGARVRMNVRLVDMNVAVPAADGREVEVLASGLPCFGGSQDGAILIDAIADKEARYAELAAGGRCRFLVFGLEVGGRFDGGSVDFLWQLALARSKTVPAYLRRSTAAAFYSRWSRLVAVAAASAWAASVLTDAHVDLDAPELAGGAPWLPDLFCDERPRDLQDGAPER